MRPRIRGEPGEPRRSRRRVRDEQGAMKEQDVDGESDDGDAIGRPHEVRPRQHAGQQERVQPVSAGLPREQEIDRNTKQ